MGLLRDKPREVGRAVSSDMFNREWPDHVGSSRERMIHMASPEFGMASLWTLRQGPIASFTWPSANKPVAMPFRVFTGMTVYQLGTSNGNGTMTDSFDIGIYDAAWNRKVSGGGTARSGASSIQFVDVTDTFLQAGSYYLVCSTNGVTASQQIGQGSLSAVFLSGLGCFDSGTNAYPLPDPLTNMVTAATFTVIPWLVIAARVPF